MIVKCPNCGAKIRVKGTGGRKRLNIPLRNVSEALQLHRSAELAARELGCSVGYLYQELKKKGLKPRDIINNTRAGKIVEDL